jgi:multiple sugar transport system permease protein
MAGGEPMADLAYQPRPAPVKRTGAGRLTRQERLAYRILVPVLGTIALVVSYPLVVALIQSVTTATGQFVGLANYARALQNPLLYESLRATGIYAAIVLPTEILLGLGLALLVHRQVQSLAIRAAIYVLAIIPLVVPPVAVGVVARLIYAGLRGTQPLAQPERSDSRGDPVAWQSDDGDAGSGQR